ncbi:hypothetical protein [Thiorhodococcus minor]|uniref:Uncharacterized protein n=1 Tax=Thiorhodococcus minor TaxID=57489 RepID=A0A6M0K8N5_9GAMM|nr:hypothetical protein [Thiorhodococcus minor]NEV64765.1 hypothetical protein [Thiorhodococcus minor]
MHARGAGSDAIRDATKDADKQIKQFAEAQATWLELVSLKDQTLFLEEQKAPYDAWRADMEALIEGQNSTLRQVVMQAAVSLRARTPGMESRSTESISPKIIAAPIPPKRVIPWG